MSRADRTDRTARCLTTLGLALGVLALVMSVLIPAAASQAPGDAVEVTVSCLAENGRIDVVVSNDTEAQVEVDIVLTGLSPRTGLVDVDDSRRFTITGRPDGDYQLSVRLDGVELVTQTLTVDCDPPAPELAIAQCCLVGDGSIDVAVASAEADTAEYVVFIGSLAADAGRAGWRI